MYSDLICQIYDRFDILCIKGDIDDIENLIKEFNVDVNHDDGYF